MTKARITYRFDHDKEQFSRLAKQDDGSKDSSPMIQEVHRDQKMDQRKHEDQEIDSPSERKQVDALDQAAESIYDSQMLNLYTNDYGAWSSPFDIEVERLEQLIRESSREGDADTGEDKPSGFASANDETNDSFDLQLIQTDDVRRRSGMDTEFEHGGGVGAADDEERDGLILFDLDEPQPAHSYRSPLSWFRLAASALGAIATGVLFGLFVIQMFSNLTQPEAPPVFTPQGPEDHSTQQPAADPDHPEEAGALDNRSVSVHLPEHTVYMLQFGVFSTLEGAQAAQNQLRQLGIASAYEAREKHVVYAGLTPDRNSALLLSNQLSSLDLETYVKPYERPAIQAIQWGDSEAEHVQAYFTDGADLARMVSLLTLVHLEEKVLTNFEDETIQALTASHQGWSMHANRIAGAVPEAAEALFEAMNNSLTTAVNSLLEYKKNPSVSYLWQAQSAVMQYVIQERALLATLAE